MVKRNFSTLKQFQENLHSDGFTFFDHNGTSIPCIVVKKEKYDYLLSKTFGKKYSVDTVLDIFYDGVKHVFVDIQLNFTNIDLEENFLFYANESLNFFEALSQSNILAILPAGENMNNSNIFMIQLPNRTRTLEALKIIRTNLKL